MKSTSALHLALSAVPLATAQVVDWCKDDKCADCVSGITSAGSGYPQCAIYDTETVFGGQGFEKVDTGDLLYKVFGNFAEPCGGAAGNLMVRSPASLATQGCGNLIFNTVAAKCSAPLNLEKTFMVQFCCGEGDCTGAGVTWGKRSIRGGRAARAAAAGSGLQGMFLKFKNGTIIPPLAVGNPPPPPATNGSVSKRCDGYKPDSYKKNGDSYFKTFSTTIVSASQAASKEERTIELSYDQSFSTTTSFDVSVGDPFGIISVSVGFSFTKEEAKGVKYSFTIPAGESGRVGFTPVYKCVKGTLTTCADVVTAEQEACTAYKIGDVVQGDYALVQD